MQVKLKSKNPKGNQKALKTQIETETQVGWTDSKGGAETREDAGDEHVKPKSSGGTDTWTRLALADHRHHPFIESWWVRGCSWQVLAGAQVWLMGEQGGGRTKTRHWIHRKTRTMAQRSLLEIWPKQVVKLANGNIWRRHTHIWWHWMRKPGNLNLEIDNQEQEYGEDTWDQQPQPALPDQKSTMSSEEETSGDFLPLYVRWMLRVWAGYKKKSPFTLWNL